MAEKEGLPKEAISGVGAGSSLFSSPVFSSIYRYRIPFIVGVILLTVFVAGILVLRHLAAKKEGEATTRFAEAYKVYSEAVTNDKSLEEALALYESVVSDYQGTTGATMSLFYAGNCQYSMERYDDAITSYNSFLEQVANEYHLELLAYDSLGYCYEAKKDFTNAVESFKKTVSPAPGLGESGYLNIARCYELLGDTENSAAFYKKIVLEYPNGRSIDFVKEKIRVLESNGREER
ncbi:MAG: tetratricopeptide repeat protein [Deltaproteobacteria bacterium]|nr:tetratricopeptide repeat protein [Deltaproteobacteria bacterium]